jgi:hypothetical protein
MKEGKAGRFGEDRAVEKTGWKALYGGLWRSVRPQSCVNPLQVIPTASVISIENLWDTDAAALHASL